MAKGADRPIHFIDGDGKTEVFCPYINGEINFSPDQGFKVDKGCIMENLVSIKVFTYIQLR
jgi:hypothetical protein